ncbi:MULTISPECIES: cytidine deaminase [Anaerostipes]|uniref:cytidine deaminase n=1 Tax=Anaerostipes TaxID=207244 RepID=UPI00095B074B|nr:MULTISPECIES: cytidine deaminase [Anaerostipes]MCI5623730.1 cytidine deaminase [Anaerostipes sp.]MDY2725916.1 cytidine deaminase [Anaerostipes faecalis]OLR58815.1 cytidine deaminase [Anaerostipes sp. 494a]
MEDRELLKMADQAKKNAYAPYSKFQVGAALLTKDGQVFTGCNVENSSYGAAICAERSVVVQAVSFGKQDFEAIAIASNGEGTVYPCGICRQVLHEFCPDIKVICQSNNGYEVYRLSELMPKGF